MTKTLTEQWREEELPIDLYYVIDKLGRETIGIDCGIRDMMVDAFNGGNIFIKEVLAPVPSYDEICHLNKRIDELAKDVDELHSSFPDLVNDYKRLKKQLEIATKALKKYMTFCRHPAEEALKEMEGVK